MATRVDLTNPPVSVLIDARTVRPGMTGVGRYAYNLLAALARLSGCPPIRALMLAESLEFARRDPAFETVELLEAPYSHESHPRGDLWLGSAPQRLLKLGELWHGPAFLIPGGPRPFRRIVTIHDLFVFSEPAAFPLKFRLWLRWAIRRACRGADRIIVPSQAVAAELVRMRLAPAEKIIAIHHAPDRTPELWEPEGSREKARFTPDPPAAQSRLLTIATLDLRKDPQTARAALLLYCKNRPGAEVDWLWAGGDPANDPSPAALAESAAALGFRSPGHCSAAGLRIAMEQATAYVTTSRAEGFGIPLVQALAAGRPIVATDLPVHREIAGDAAIYFKPGDPSSLAEALDKLLSSAALQKGLSEHARFRAPEFAWGKTAEKTLEAYRQASA